MEKATTTKKKSFFELQKWRISSMLLVLASVLYLYLNYSSKPSQTACSLLPRSHYWITSKQIVTPQRVISGAVEVKDGKITSVLSNEEWHRYVFSGQVIDFGHAVIMPGLIDVHAHLDDPGRAEWEGFPSGTRAAAAGGITTLIDMPLNSAPSTVSVETLNLKIKAAKDNIYVDVGFWGGLVPENALNSTALESFLRAGVLGLKSFMCPSGINDFPMTNISHIKEGLTVLAKFGRPLLVHAEIQLENDDNSIAEANTDSSQSYATYLRSRPASMEEGALRELSTVTKDTRTGGPAEGALVHVVHLSDAGASLNIIKAAKDSGDSISVETCPHYLAFSAEDIPDGDTHFKCSPPIRDAENRESLWNALLSGDIDMVSSGHSPTVPELKLLDQGDFLKAWGGISSLQFVLPVTWSLGRKYGVTLEQMVSWWSERPAKLAGQNLKGSIAVGNHADIVAWEPDTRFHLNASHPTHMKHPVCSISSPSHYKPMSISAYMGKTLSGKVLATFVRGNLVYSDGQYAPTACGNTVLAK